MARQVVYEGTDLQQLLQQVIDEHGPARIHPPERRRKGGVLGFFAREIYVITVDVDATAQAAPEQAPAPQAVARSTADEGAPVPAGARAAQSPGLGSAASAPGSGLPADAQFQSPLAALIEATEDDADLGGSNGHALPSKPLAPPSMRPEGDRGHGSPPTVPELDDIPGGATRGNGLGPRHAATPATDKPFGVILSEVASSLGEEPGTYRPDPARLKRPLPPAAGDHSGADDGAVGAKPAEAPEARAEPAEAPEARAEPAEVPEPGIATVAVQLPLIDLGDEGPPDLGATIVDLLRAAGFPEHLLPLAPLVPEPSTVEAVFASLPEAAPLPTEPGGLVAVVGAAGLVRPVAGSVALTVGLPRDEVAVASTGASDRHARPEYRARTASQAAAMSPGWRRDRVGVVAVYAPPLGADQRWTRQVLRALRPSCVWGMAGATTKPDDVRRWIGAIGGVDALVLTEVSATATPAAILSLGIPVTRLDDEPATPARWAAVVANLVTKH